MSFSVPSCLCVKIKFLLFAICNLLFAICVSQFPQFPPFPPVKRLSARISVQLASISGFGASRPVLCEKTYEKPGGLRHSATRIGSFGAKMSAIGASLRF